MVFLTGDISDNQVSTSLANISPYLMTNEVNTVDPGLSAAPTGHGSTSTYPLGPVTVTWLPGYGPNAAPTAAAPTAPTSVQLPAAPAQVVAPSAAPLPPTSSTPLPAATTPNAPSLSNTSSNTANNPYSTATYTAPANALAYAQGAAQLQGAPVSNTGGAAPTLSNGQGAPLQGGVSMNAGNVPGVPGASGMSGVAGNIPPTTAAAPAGFGPPGALAGGQAIASNPPPPAIGTTTAGPQTRGQQPQSYPQTQPPPAAQVQSNPPGIVPAPPLTNNLRSVPPNGSQIAALTGASPHAEQIQRAKNAHAQVKAHADELAKAQADLAKALADLQAEKQEDARKAALFDITAQIIDKINTDIPNNIARADLLQKEFNSARDELKAAQNRFKAQVALPLKKMLANFDTPIPELRGPDGTPMSRYQFALHQRDTAMMMHDREQAMNAAAIEVQNGANDDAIMKVVNGLIDNKEKAAARISQQFPAQGDALRGNYETERATLPTVIKQSVINNLRANADASAATTDRMLTGANQVIQERQHWQERLITAAQEVAKINNDSSMALEAAIKSKIEVQDALDKSNAAELSLAESINRSAQQAHRDQVQEDAAAAMKKLAAEKEERLTLEAIIKERREEQTQRQGFAKTMGTLAQKLNATKGVAAANTPEAQAFKALVNKEAQDAIAKAAGAQP